MHKCKEDEDELYVYALTDEEAEIVSIFSRLNECNRARIFKHGLMLLSSQLFDECKEILSKIEKDSRFNLDK